jgi:hypothetical protein
MSKNNNQSGLTAKEQKAFVQRVISDQMRRVGACLTHEERVANAKKAWQTKRAKIAAQLAAKG